MAAPSETYVDPSIAANSGTGTIGDPYGDLQYALDTMTRDSTNGDRINIKSGTAEVLTGAISLVSYGGTARNKRLIFEGYDSAAGDGGIGAIDGNNGNFSVCDSGNDLMFKNLKLFNTGTAVVLSLNNYSQVSSCEITQSSTGGILFANSPGYCSVDSCYIHDIAGYGTRDVMRIYNCYYANGTTNKFTDAVSQTSGTFHHMINGCIFNLDGSSDACGSTASMMILNSSFLSSSGTGAGITASGVHFYYNNLIEGFSGTGGKGIHIQQTDAATVAYNAFFDCETNIELATDCDVIYDDDNESLATTPFAKTGSLPTDFTSATFWSDLYAYFAPVDVGNVYSGFPTGTNQTKGAVGQPLGGGSVYSLHPLAYN
jgi:hypothetical protein